MVSKRWVGGRLVINVILFRIKSQMVAPLIQGVPGA
jgi:hypothetical protein